ncbi:MAG: GntR family transcriptional regulator [Candidatus Caldatribacterium sp.]|nr:GntR family transcriptional regulator [Candidatus Caldatribacterium sp.]
MLQRVAGYVNLERGLSMIVKDSPIPVHMQLKELLKRALESGEYRPGSRFFSESEIAQKYGVSKTTVRRAMDDLSREGFIFRVPGKGTFVARQKLVEKLTELIGFTQDMERRGTSRVPEFCSRR